MNPAPEPPIDCGPALLRRFRSDDLEELVELADDDRATIYGALLELAAKARGDDVGDTLALWKRRGKRAFDMEAGDASPARSEGSV